MVVSRNIVGLLEVRPLKGKDEGMCEGGGGKVESRYDLKPSELGGLSKFWK